MKLFVFLLVSALSFAQEIPNTEVYLFEIKNENRKVQIENGINISKNSGYDNQPSFFSDEVIVFAGNREDQTDIATYSIKSAALGWFTKSTPGGEYSPQRIPNSKNLAAVRLDTSGLQRLYKYDGNSRNSDVLLPNLKVGYFAFYDENQLISAVLNGNTMDLVYSNIQTKKDSLLVSNVGRSIHKVPNSTSVSYTVVNENKNMDLYLLDFSDNLNSYFICELPIGIQDYTWLDENQILLGSRDKLYLYDTLGITEWTEIASLKDYNINNITRLAVNPSETKLALVGESLEKSPEEIVQQQLVAYNSRDIDAFMATYSDNIRLYDFPEKLSSEGKEAMREGYKSFFEQTEDLHCEIKNRIVIGNKVIDEEYITANGNSFSAVAIYEIENGKIAKVTFVR